MSARDDEPFLRGSTLTNSAVEPSPRPVLADGVAPRLEPGMVLSRRYLVQRFIARGGMGEVYAVEDLELHQQIALKTISPERANEPGARERFRREVQLSRRVTHPNVCRLFDVGFHDDPKTGTIIFLTMELLEGETLASRLVHGGRMDLQAALPLAEQIALALDAAHSAGVVHCDLKPHNVLLVSRGDDQPPRVVVTDFGLARALGPDSANPSLPVEERMFGTPAYMAPEQVRGRAVTSRCDIYALGVTLFQIATGELPFVGSSRRETATMRLTHPPAAPRDLVPDIDPRWERAILHCLEREPERRPAHAADAVRHLRARRHPSRRAWAVSLALVALVGSTAATWMMTRHRRIAGRTNAGRHSLAVVGWSDRGMHADEAWIGTALGVLVGDELAAGDELRLARPDEVARARREHAGAGVAMAAATLERMRAELDVDDIVTGTYEVRAGRLEVVVRVVDARGRDVVTASDGAPLDQVRGLATRLGALVRQKLGVGPAAADERRRLDASLPSSPEVIRLYAEGEACALVYDHACAVEKLKEVVRREPQLVMARRALSDAYRALNKPADSLAEAKAAFEASGSLTREERILTEAVYRTRAGQLDEGIKLYQALATFYPDQTQYALSAIEFTCQAGRCDDSLKALDQLRHSPNAADDARVDAIEAKLALHAGDFARAIKVARRAVDKARRRGARLLLADARISECNALEEMGDAKNALAACDEGLEVFQRAGDRGNVARVYVLKGNIAKFFGRLDDARAAYEKAGEVYRELGSARGLSLALGNIATVTRRQGKLDESRRILDECIALDRREQLTMDEAIDLANLGRLLHDMGDAEGARAQYEQSLAISRKLGSLRKTGPYALGDLGMLAMEGGQFDEAQHYFDESLKLLQESNEVIGEINLLDALASLAMFEDRFADAQALIAKVKTLPHASSDEADAESEMTEASLATAERHFDEAERLSRHAADTLHRAKNEAEPLVLTTLAEALVGAGKIDEARTTIERAKQLTIPGADGRVALSLVDARAVAAGDETRGLQALGEVRDQAKRLGLVGRELWARFYAARFKEHSTPSEAHAELRAVRRDARAHHMAWLARLAAR